MKEIVVTAVGPDREGLVEEFAVIAHAAGANIANSRMANLRGSFALVALLEGTEASLSETKKGLVANASKLGLSITFSTEPSSEAKKGVPFKLKTYSMDQPGIVHRFASFLRVHGVNIEALETSLESAPFAGTPVFKMEAVILVPKAVATKSLRQSLEAIGAELNCDVDLDPA